MLLVLGLFLLLFATPASAQRFMIEPVQQARVDSVFSFVDRDAPGCSMGIVQNRKLLYGRGYGLANLDWGIPASTSTVYDIGSVSKQFTATAVALLDLDGVLSLEDDIRKWVPEMPEYTIDGTKRTITIRHLLNHTSGMRDYLTLMSLSGENFIDVFDEFDGVDLIVKQQALNFAPGEEYLYSNSGYLMLANIVRRASGKSVRVFLEERVFDPLGMANTSIWDDNKETVHERATGYSPEGDGWGIDHAWNFQMGGDGQVLTSVDDLVKWENNFQDRIVGGQPLMDHLHKRAILNSGDTLRYALGLNVDTYRGIRRVGHGGSWAGFRADIKRFPDQATSVIVLCNRGNANAGQYATKIVDIVLSEYLDPVEEDDSEDGAASTETVTLTESELKQWVGLYRAADEPQYYPISYSEGILYISAGDDSDPMSPYSVDHFNIDNYDVGVFFSRDEEKTSVRFGSRDEEPLFRVEQTILNASDLPAYAGTYSSEELGVDYTIRIEDGELSLQQVKGDWASLKPGSGLEFTSNGIAITFERSSGAITGFRVFAGRVTGILFEKQD